MPPSAIGSVLTEERSEARPEPYADAALPDEADFADEVDKEITADNYAAKLGELEKEIAEADVDAGGRKALDAGSATPGSSAAAGTKASSGVKSERSSP